MWPWRIVLAPPGVVRQLIARGKLRPMVDRQQIYYGVTTETLRVGTTSVKVKVTVEVERDYECLKRDKVTEAEVVFVQIGEDQRPLPLPHGQLPHGQQPDSDRR